jgi:hypothetical protein
MVSLEKTVKEQKKQKGWDRRRERSRRHGPAGDGVDVASRGLMSSGGKPVQIGRSCRA